MPKTAEAQVFERRTFGNDCMCEGLRTLSSNKNSLPLDFVQGHMSKRTCGPPSTNTGIVSASSSQLSATRLSVSIQSRPPRVVMIMMDAQNPLSPGTLPNTYC